MCLRSIAAQTMSASNTTAAACQAVRRLVVGEVPMAVTSLMGGSVSRYSVLWMHPYRCSTTRWMHPESGDQMHPTYGMHPLDA